MKLAEVRSKFPQYDDLPDDALVGALHKKYYSDIPEAEFHSQVGYQPAVAAPKKSSARAFAEAVSASKPGLPDYLKKKTSVVEGMDGHVSTATPVEKQMVREAILEQNLRRDNSNVLKPGAEVTGFGKNLYQRSKAAIARANAGVLQAAADITGSDTLARGAKASQDYAADAEGSVILKPGTVEGFAQDSIAQELPEAALNAATSVIQTAPALVAGAVNPALALPTLMGSVTAQEYAEGRQAGLAPTDAAVRAPLMGAFEVIGEKLGGTQRLATALNTLGRGHGATELAAALLSSSAREIPSEMATTVGQFGVDKMPGIGLNQEAGIDDLGRQLKDTVLATVLQAGGMTLTAKGIQTAHAISQVHQLRGAGAVDQAGADSLVKEISRQAGPETMKELQGIERAIVEQRSNNAVQAITDEATTLDDAISLANESINTPLHSQYQAEAPEAVLEQLGAQDAGSIALAQVDPQIDQAGLDDAGGSLAAGNALGPAGQPGIDTGNGTPGADGILRSPEASEQPQALDAIEPGQVQAKVDVGSGAIVTSGGTPYKTELGAQVALKAKNLQGRYQVAPIADGFGLMPITQEESNAEQAATAVLAEQDGQPRVGDGVGSPRAGVLAEPSGQSVQLPDPATQVGQSEQRDIPDGTASGVADPAVADRFKGDAIDDEWTSFADQSGTLKIPRAEMPQILAEHRGAMVNFLNARGITHEQAEVPAAELKPTQAEFSQAKVDKASKREGGTRSILVSEDGHVLDGHHQWMAAVEKGEPVPVIRLKAPIQQLLQDVREFPSVEKSDGVVPQARPALPETVSNGPTSLNTTPIGKTVYRETNASGLDDLLRISSTGGGITSVFVADNPDLAIGQGDNRGITIQFRGDAMSGREHQKPMTGDLAGREYKTDFVGADAIDQIMVTGNPILRGLTNRFLAQHFDKQKLDGGRTLYTRKGHEVGESLNTLIASESMPEADAGIPASPVTPLIDRLVKRRAAAVQIGKRADFDTAMAAAKKLAEGQVVKPSTFARLQRLFTGKDQQLADLMGELHALAKEPAKVQRSAKKEKITALREAMQAAVDDGDQAAARKVLQDAQRDADLTDAELEGLDTMAASIEDQVEDLTDDEQAALDDALALAERMLGPDEVARIDAEVADRMQGMSTADIERELTRVLNEQGQTQAVRPEAGRERSGQEIEGPSTGKPTESDQGASQEVGAGENLSLFSRSGDQMTPERVESFVNSIASRWENAPDIVVVKDMEDTRIRKAVRDENERQLSQGASGQPEGFFDNGKVYIVASEMNSPGDVMRVLFHEALGHYGMRGVFGESLKPILKEVSVLRRLDVKAKAEEYGLNFADESDRLIAAEEVLAEMAQRNPKASIVKRAIAAIKAFLRKNIPGFSEIALSDSDIISQYLIPARQFVAKASIAPDNSPVMREMLYSRAAKVGEDALKAHLAKNRQFREEHISIWDKSKKWLRRQFTPGGLLPKGVFEQKIVRDSEFQAVEFDVATLVAGLERAIKQDYQVSARNLDSKVQELLNGILAGKDIAQDIPEKTRVALVGMRQYIDGLSTQYLQALQSEIMTMVEVADHNGDEATLNDLQGKVDLFNTISANIGQYVHRSYRAFDDPSWARKIPDDVLNAARDYLIARNVNVSRDDAERRAEIILNEIVKHGTAFESMDAFIKESKLGAKDISMLKQRKEIAPQIRALLGEYEDPRINFAKSATKMGRLIYNQAFLTNIRKQGMGVFLFTGETKPPEATVKLAAEGSEVMAPLNGIWVTPEIAQAFRDAVGKEKMEDWYRNIVRINGLVKFGKTVLSPTTAARNWMSAFFFSIANGHFNLGHMGKSIAGIKEYFTHAGEKEQLAYLRELKQLGVVYDTPYAGEMMRLLDDSGTAESLVNNEKLEPVKKTLDLATKFYQYGDDFWKIIGFENEKAMWVDAGYTEQEAKERAAERVRNTYPTYSMIGRGIQSLRRFPLVGTFVSFPAEIIRTQFNMLKYLHEDFQDESTRNMAVRRAVGMAITNSFAFGLMKLSMSMLGFDDDDDEAARLMAAPWQKNSMLLYTGRDEQGHVRFIDLSFLDPYNYFKRPIMAIVQGKGLDNALLGATKEILEPFLGTDITAQAVFEVLANQKETGQKIYQPHDEALNQALDIGQHIRKNLQPGIFSNLERTWKAIQGEVTPTGRKYSLQDEGMAWVGFRMSTVDPKVALYYRSFDFQDAKGEAEKKIRDVARNPNDVSESTMRSAYDTAMETRRVAYKEMHSLALAAIRGGMTKPDVRKVFKNSGISERDALHIINGTVPDWKPSRQSIRQQANKARAMLGPEQAKQVRQRYRELSSYSSQSTGD